VILLALMAIGDPIRVTRPLNTNVEPKRSVRANIVTNQGDVAFTPNNPEFVFTPQNGPVLSAQFIGLTEVNALNLTVQTLDLQNGSAAFITTPFSFLPQDGEGYSFSSRLVTSLGHNVTVEIDVGLFTQQNELFFANTSFEVQPNDLKWTVRISKWPFQSVTSILQLEVSLGDSDGLVNNITKTAVATTKNGVVLAKYILTTTSSQIDLLVFERAELENLADQNSTIPVTTLFLLKPGGVSFVTQFPYFIGTVNYDPVVSLMSEQEGGDGFDWQLLVAVVVPVVSFLVFLAILLLIIIIVVAILLVVYLRRRRMTMPPYNQM